MSLRGDIIRIVQEYLDGVKITELPAGTAPSGTELIEVVQGGVNVQLTVSQVSSGGSGVVQTIVAGTNVTVDSTDPANPIVSASSGSTPTLQQVITAGSALTLTANITSTADINASSEVSVHFGVGSGVDDASINLDAATGDIDITSSTGEINFTANGFTINGAAGTAGQVLTSNGTGLAPTWQAGGGGGSQTIDQVLVTGNQITANRAIRSDTDGVHQLAIGSDLSGGNAVQALILNSKVQTILAAGLADADNASISVDVSSGIIFSGAGTGNIVTINPPTIFGSTVTLGVDGSTGLEAVTYQQLITYLPLAGGTLTGVLTLNADPVNPLEAATKAYVDAAGGGAITLTGEATGTGTGSFAVTLTNSAVIGKVLTGYVSGAGTVAATDTILQAIQKLNGNNAGNWLLASGGTLTGVNTITSTIANGIVWTGTINPTTANNQYTQTWTNAVTLRGTASDNFFVHDLSPSITYGANDQNAYVLRMNLTSTVGGFTGVRSNFLLCQFAGTTVLQLDADGTMFFGSAVSNRPRIAISNTSGSGSVSGLTLRAGGAWTNADSCCLYVTTGNVTFTSTGSFNARLIHGALPSFSPSSGAYGVTGFLLDGSFSPSGSYSGTFRAMDINVTGTHTLGTYYGITVRDPLFLNGFGVASPANAIVVIGAGTTTVAPLKLTSGTNLTTAVNGCMEYNGTDLLFTKSGATRGNVLVATAVTTEVVVSDTTLTITYLGTTYKVLVRA